MKIKRMPILLSMITAIIVIIGGTLAWSTIRGNKTAMVLTIGNINNVRIKIHPYQLNETIGPVNLYTDVTPINVEVINSTSDPSSIGLYFRINTITSDATLKYAIEKSSDGTNYTLCTTCGGNFENATSGTRMYILEEEVNPGTHYYRVYIYLDGTVSNTTSIDLDMELRGALPEIPGFNSTDFSDLVYKVRHDAIGSISATNDNRYYGSDPNNYVCLDFEDNATCPDKHLYRIIGTVRNDNTGDMELKLIKANPLEDDNSNTTFAWDSNDGNDWTTSSLLTILNNNYLNSTGDFVNSGLSSQAKSLISTATYYLNGLNNNNHTNTPGTFYQAERTGASTWIGSIGLMTSSDYGYASSKTCYLNNIISSCNNKNWLNTNTNEWTMTKSTVANDIVYYKDTNNNILYDTTVKTSSLHVVRPVMYMKANVIVLTGIGTEANPYLLDFPTLYNALKSVALNDRVALEFTGTHQDDFNGTRSTDKIYYWRSTADDMAIVNMYNVVFAGYCWQMMRTTDTGGVRLLYNGEPTISTENGKTLYYCGPNRIGTYRIDINLSGNYYYSNSYTVTENGNTATFQLLNPTQVQVTSNNASTVIPDIAENYPYTCKSTNSSYTCSTMYKVDTGGVTPSSTTVSILSTETRDSIAKDVFNANSGITKVGYMHSNYSEAFISARIIENIDSNSASKYLFGQNIVSNGDGTFSLTGTIQEISSSQWESLYQSAPSGFVCFPNHYTYDSNNNTNTCFDNSTENNSKAIGYISQKNRYDFYYFPLYKYGYGVQLNGNNYELIADNDNTDGTLQYVYDFAANQSTTVGAVGSLNTTSGCYGLSKSHYTCKNLSGKCTNYEYIYKCGLGYSPNRTYIASIIITNGKYVSTDWTDTDNVIYDILYSSNANINNSSIKTIIDAWYVNNLYDNYDNYIDDTVYCGNRTLLNPYYLSSTSTLNTNTITFNSYPGNTVSSLLCSNVADQYSVANNDAKLTYKIGLMSLNELGLFGSGDRSMATRASAGSYFLMTPGSIQLTNQYSNYYLNVGVYAVAASGTATGAPHMENQGNIRPAISLIKGLKYSSGTGTIRNPYIVDAPPIVSGD